MSNHHLERSYESHKINMFKNKCIIVPKSLSFTCYLSPRTGPSSTSLCKPPVTVILDSIHSFIPNDQPVAPPNSLLLNPCAQSCPHHLTTHEALSPTASLPSVSPHPLCAVTTPKHNSGPEMFTVVSNGFQKDHYPNLSSDFQGMLNFPG